MIVPQQRTGLETLFLAGIDVELYLLGRAMNFAQSITGRNLNLPEDCCGVEKKNAHPRH